MRGVADFLNFISNFISNFIYFHYENNHLIMSHVYIAFLLSLRKM